MVSYVEELTAVQGWVRELPGGDDVAVGAMVETPSAALRAGALARVSDFLSFGTNDLTQLVLGLSRDDVEPRLLPEYRRAGIVEVSPFDRLDRAVVDLVRLAVEGARAVRPDLPIGICGEQAADEPSVAAARAAGLDSVSCSPFRVPAARLAAGLAALVDDGPAG